MHFKTSYRDLKKKIIFILCYINDVYQQTNKNTVENRKYFIEQHFVVVSIHEIKCIMSKTTSQDLRI